MASYSQGEKDLMAERYSSGMSIQKVATSLGRSLYGVYYALKKMGVPIRSLSEAGMGKDCSNRKPRGPVTIEQRRKMSARAKARGSSHNWFVDGKGDCRDTSRRAEMNRLEYRLWREAVFFRDNFCCQDCGKRGGKIQADHLKPWSSHPELRYSVENGRTLCEPCHFATPTYGAKSIRRKAEVSDY